MRSARERVDTTGISFERVCVLSSLSRLGPADMAR
jgi:hypothetical protein